MKNNTYSIDIMDIDFDSLEIIVNNINNNSWDDVWAENIGVFEMGMIIEHMELVYGKTVIITYIHWYIGEKFAPLVHFQQII